MSPEHVPSGSTAVVTVAHGRHDHLRVQRRFLARCDPPPDLHVVVAMDDAGIEDVLADVPGLKTRLVTVPGAPAGLPVAAARNAGVRAALENGAGTLILLDVDCIPAPGLVGEYDQALDGRPDAIVCGPVTYLPPPPEGGWTLEALVAERAPHPARPDPPAGTYAPIGPALFWSLSFAVRAATWERLGGFYEGYVGYGGEDTDLGYVAAGAGVEILFGGWADAYHQHHPTSEPPVEHLDDIVRNSAIFQRRHGVLPMVGWLAAFREAGLTESVGGLPRRRDATRLLTVPARHPYLDAVLPTGVARVDTGRVVAWEPDPLLGADAFDAVASRVDVVHVHFGYEHVEPHALQAWLDALRRRNVPLVLTVHDLHNPHLVDVERHIGQLRQLAGHAARVITLTSTAAERCERLFGRPVDVLAHPTLVEGDLPPTPARRDLVLVPLKTLRANVSDGPRLVEIVADAAARAGARTRVLLDPAADRHPDYRAVLRLDDRDDVEVVLAGHVPHRDVVAGVVAARALVLPYRFGTHSGWIELARDTGTAVVAPDCGAYADQGEGVRVYGNNEQRGLDTRSLGDAVTAAVEQDPPVRADRTARLAQRDLVRAAHEALYRAVRS